MTDRPPDLIIIGPPGSGKSTLARRLAEQLGFVHLNPGTLLRQIAAEHSATGQQVRDLVERMLKTSGRRLDVSSPFVDAALPDGSRLHVVIPDVTRKHWAVNIRKFIAKARRLEHLVELGSLNSQAAKFLGAAVAS